jgi:hypothetical protein
MRFARALWVGAALAAAPAFADVTLSGFQHIGDGETASFDPDDPVTRGEMEAKPSYFHLSQDLVVTAIRLEDPNSLDGQLQVFIDDMTTPLPGTLSGSTYTLTTPLPLPAGTHTIWPDGGCTLGGFGTCLVGENDFGFSAITLVSTLTTFSRSFNHRSHLGDNNEGNNDYGGSYYPDAAEGSVLTRTFTLETSRVLSEIRFYRARDVLATAGVKVTLDGTDVGTLTANGEPAPPLSPGVVVLAGAHTLTLTSLEEAINDFDDLSWDDIVLVFINNPAITPGQFNAVDLAADAATGAITTKQAGTAFSLDLVAVSGGAQFTAYSGTLNVELVDASSAAGSCTTWPQLANLGSVAFGGADAGRKTVAITYAEAARDVRVRLYDATLAITSCSVDNFAIRPASFGNLAVTHGSPTTAGTTEPLDTSGPYSTGDPTPIHRAGRPFTISATAYNGAGAVTQNYAGSPSLTAVASLLGTNTGTASASGWSYPSQGSLRSDQATYDEAGAVTLKLVDTDFAAVDSLDTALAVREFSGTIDVGRFTPDHFKFEVLAAGAFQPGCVAGGFTYVGQPFFLSTLVPAPQARITAVAADGTTATRNYTELEALPRHAAAAGSLPQSDYDVTIDAGGTALTATTFQILSTDPDNTFVSEGDGKYLFTAVAPAAGWSFTRGLLIDPFTAAIKLTPTLDDPDGVALLASGAFGAAWPGVAFTGGGNAVRFGRLVVDNANGSERLPLNLPLRAEYWTGSGFQTYAADSCSVLVAGNLQQQPGGTVAPAQAWASTTPASGAWTLQLTLAPPYTPGFVRIRAVLGIDLPWLQVDRDVDGDYDDDPEGQAQFGVSNDQPRRIFQREVIGY